MMTQNQIMNELDRHYQEALKRYKKSQIVAICLQGSQNYGLDIEGSDIDTKCILTPTFKDIAMANQMVSTTHVLDNNEHLDAKDIRAYISCFRKQNLNFLEILFTPYFIVNGQYYDQWQRLIEARESIARMNEYRAVKSMKGIALEKYYAMEHPYPSKLEVLAKYGYDPKQLHHLVRVDNYLTRYIGGESYENCLVPDKEMREFLLDIKMGNWNLAAARELAKQSLDHVELIADTFCSKSEDKEDAEMRALLQDVQYEIMKIAVESELKK